MKKGFYLFGGILLIYGLLLLTKNRLNSGILLFIFSGIVCTFIGYRMSYWSTCWKKHKWFRLSVFTGSLLFLVYFVSMESMIVSHMDDERSEQVDYVIVLGAGIIKGKPSLVLEERLALAITYLENNRDANVIVSGGIDVGEKISEAEAMRIYLVNAGIDEERIMIEDQATSTYENLLFSKELMENNKEKVLIITSDFHLFRSKYIAESIGLEAFGTGASVPAPLIPLVHTREMLAILKTVMIDVSQME
ncbi:YdcF family protein [Bacillus sp. 2205SS5-2]|uniref:YdcF family protein n=1 Tax=Bacillus sp. 2205SS5-2 TaxID=3109031 RepID=UPI0030075E5F